MRLAFLFALRGWTWAARFPLFGFARFQPGCERSSGRICLGCSDPAGYNGQLFARNTAPR